MKRIVHLIPNLTHGGAEISLTKLILNTSCYDHHVITLLELGPLADLLRDHHIPVTALNLNNNKIKGLWRLKTLLQQLNPDILQSWLYRSDLIGLVFGKWCGIQKIFWNIRCSDALALSRSHFLKIAAFCSRFPNGIVVNSLSGKTFHEQVGYQPLKWHLIPNAFDIERFKPCSIKREITRKRLGIKDDHFLIGLVARFDVLKDHRTFLQSAQLVRFKIPYAKFICVGKGINQSSFTYLIPEGLKDHLYLLDDQRDLSFFYPALDLKVLTSLSEGFPNVLGEAMSCGIPCIATNVGDCAALIDDTGFVVPAQNPQALAEMILRFINLETKQNLSFKARQRIINHFSLEKMINRYRHLYDN